MGFAKKNTFQGPGKFVFGDYKKSSKSDNGNWNLCPFISRTTRMSQLYVSLVAMIAPLNSVREALRC